MSETSYGRDREARAHWIQALQRKAALADQLACAVLNLKPKGYACDFSYCEEYWMHIELLDWENFVALARKVKGGSDGQ